MEVFYYNYFYFYSRVLKEEDPHLFTTLSLSFSTTLYAIFIVDVFLYNTINIFMNLYVNIAVLVLLTFVFYTYYYRMCNGIEIVRRHPMFFENQRLSSILSIIYWVISFLLMFIHPMIFKFYIKGDEFKWF